MEIPTLGVLCFFATFMALQTGVQGIVGVDVTISEPPGGTHYPGHNVTVVCRMTGGYPGIIVYWFKMIVQKSGRHRQELIATNDDLAPLYKNVLNRFEAKVVNTHEGVSLFILNIYGITREDTGHYGCSVPRADNAYSQGELEVAVPPSDIFFSNYSNGDTIEFNEGEAVNIQCHIEEVLPEPTITITIGSKVYDEGFVINKSLREKCELGGVKKCPLHFTYDYVIANPSFMPDHQADGGVLECAAEIPDTHYQPTVTSLKVRVNYAPRIECEPILKAAVGFKFDMKCRVRAQPPPTGLRWEFTLDGEIVALDAYHTTEDKSFESYVEVIDAQTRDVTLLINRVEDRHLIQYELVAENKRWKSSQAVVLERDESVPVDSSSTTLAISSFILFICYSATSVL